MTGKPLVFRFGDVEVHEREFSIVKTGEILTVEPKAFRVLLFLLHNPQKLISKEELLNAVWGDTAVSENSLTRSIALLRKLLDDDSRDPHYIETVATVGYRWVCKVEVSEDHAAILERADEASSVHGEALAQAIAGSQQGAEADPKNGDRSDRTHSGFLKWLLSGAAAIVLGLAVLIWFLHRPLPLPRIVAYTPITHDGHEKSLAGSDGNRLYFMQMQPRAFYQVGVSGGEVAQISTSVPGLPFLLNISPDASSLLFFSLDGKSPDGSLWISRVLGGTSRRLTNGCCGTFSPDGNSIVYMGGPGEIWQVQIDGTGAHRLASLGPSTNGIHESPDGKVFRFERGGMLWEVSADGSNPHQAIPGWKNQAQQCCGAWTPDGKFYFFMTLVPGWWRGDKIWILDERRGLFRHPSKEPVQLTSGPIRWGWPAIGKGSTKIFSDGKTPRGELSRFDPKTKQLQPFLGGISAQDVSFSRDGRSVAYVTYPDGVLWKANLDGSDPIQLSTSAMYAANPLWSPDGSQIAFYDNQVNAADTIYLVSSQGGHPQRLLPDSLGEGYSGDQNEPSWSADGRKIAFQAPADKGTDELCIFDLSTRKVTPIPGTYGLSSPRWSPDGKYISAVADDSQNFKLFEVATRRWSILSVGKHIDYPAWSHDSSSLYFVSLANGDRSVTRVRVNGGKVERAVDLKDWHITGYYSYWMALDPTDSPLLLRDVGSDEIYALTLEEK
jgi:Tol biopolymer transport system component/DNA-binding winged helix-turn-helix (wHTH) protein